MPNMSKEARKRKLADWVVHTKKQVVKLYAVAKWSRDADAVQKCMVGLSDFLAPVALSHGIFRISQRFL